MNIPKGKKKFKIKFPDGQFSFVDEKIFKIFQEYDQREKNFKKLPKFYDLTSYIDTYDKRLLEFYSFILMNHHISFSQLFQDLFVIFCLKYKKNGKFLEFGATNGLKLSNTFLLEKNFGWQGVLAEPSPQWHKELKKNRPSTTIITDCIFTSSGDFLDFFVSKSGELSTLQEFRYSTKDSISCGNDFERNKSGYLVKVSTISLNDVFKKYFESKPIDYMSVDTEGSELAILENFDFEKFGPKILTVEHNEVSEYQEKIHKLLEKNNYRLAFKEYSQFDGWYIRKI